MHMSSSWERPSRNQQRGKTPSFSSSLLESIYHSIDESQGGAFERSFIRRNNSGREVGSLRRAIMVEKWMENHAKNSDSNSSTDSTASVSETESSASRSSVLTARKTRGENFQFAKARKPSILNLYGDLKKTKQPISPGRKICNFLNSIFTSKTKHHHETEEWSSVRKSRSMKASTSCLSKTPSSKSKRSVRFCPVNVILDDDRRPDGEFIRNDFSRFGDLEVKKVVRGMYNDEDDDDGRSCGSSDLFELENIGIAGHVDARRDELPVYGTTSLKINHAIASGLFM